MYAKAEFEAGNENSVVDWISDSDGEIHSILSACSSSIALSSCISWSLFSVVFSLSMSFLRYFFF